MIMSKLWYQSEWRTESKDWLRYHLQQAYAPTNQMASMRVKIDGVEKSLAEWKEALK